MANGDAVKFKLSSEVPAEAAQPSLRETLQAQDLRLRRHLKRAMLLIVFAVFVIISHQVIVTMHYPVKGWYSLAHIALLAIAFALVYSARVIWTSYLGLQSRQKDVLSACAHFETLNEVAGESLRKSDSLLEALFGAITDRILVVDQYNCIVRANRIAAIWAGCDPAYRKFSDIYPTCDSQGERRNELAVIEYSRATQKICRRRLLRGGADCSMLLSVDTYPVSHPDDNSNLVIAIARDVTEQAGNELVSRHREKMAALGLLVAGIAHDLGNPLASLSSELELLYDKYPETIYGSLDTINEHVERIKRKLHSIVEFAHRRDVAKCGTDLRVAVDSALKLTRYDPRARRVQFSIDVNEDLSPVCMKIDDLVLVLINLIVNAFDAMPQGGELSIRASMTTTGDALLTVADTGVGMAMTTLQQATLPLFTTKNIYDKTGGGAGLGLTMVKQLMNAVGGQLVLASELGHGTHVMLQLPLV